MPNYAAAEAQAAERDRELDSFIVRFCKAAADGDANTAEALVRDLAIAEIVTRRIDLHHEMQQQPVGAADAVTNAAHPAALITLGFARMQAAGNVDGLRTALATAARTLHHTSTTHVAQRCRDLSLAALAYALLGMSASGDDVARRGITLVQTLDADSPLASSREVALAAADLAMACFLIDDLPGSVSMWQWIRERRADPSDPIVMQADWGLSIVGVILGTPSIVSPIARMILDYTADSGRNVLTSTRDPWWAMVQTARTWAALDAHDVRRALEVSRRAVAYSATPLAVGPLVLVHALALTLSGRAAAAVEFLRLAQEGEQEPDTVRVMRSTARVFAVALTGADAEPVLKEPAFVAAPVVGNIARAYARLVQGHSDALSVLPDDDALRIPNPRLRLLAAVIRATAHARAGNEAAALEAMEVAAAISDTYGVGAWTLLIPEPELLQLQDFAMMAGKPALLEAFPEHSNIVSTERPVELTEREREVLLLVQEGLTNSQIASRMFISPNTVKFHVANLLRRLGVSTREEAAALHAGGRKSRPGRNDG